MYTTSAHTQVLTVQATQYFNFALVRVANPTFTILLLLLPLLFTHVYAMKTKPERATEKLPTLTFNHM